MTALPPRISGEVGMVVAMLKCAIDEAQMRDKAKQDIKHKARDWLHSEDAEHWLSLLNGIFDTDYTIDQLLHITERD